MMEEGPTFRRVETIETGGDGAEAKRLGIHYANNELWRRDVEPDPARQLTGDINMLLCRMLNHYACPRCQYRWSDRWPGEVDNDCPQCGARHVDTYLTEEVMMEFDDRYLAFALRCHIDGFTDQNPRKTLVSIR